MEKSEYEIQHFGFSAEQVSLERTHFLNLMISMALDSMVEHLSEGNEERIELLENRKAMVRCAMHETFKKHLEAAEELDKKNFSIPDYVLLASDYGHTRQYKEQDEEDIDREIDLMKFEYLENTVMIATIKSENAKYAAIEEFVQEELTLHQQISQSMSEAEAEYLKLCELVQKTKTLIKYADEFAPKS